jgi:hypothetical protein
MTRPDDERPRLLTRAFWAMMALAALSFIAASVVVSVGPRILATRPAPPAHAAPLAGEARGAKDGHARSPLGPP